MDEDLDRLLELGDPVRSATPLDVEVAARQLMASATGSLRRRSVLAVVVAALGLIAVGGGTAFAAPVVASIFAPQVTPVAVRIETHGSSTVHCTAEVITSIKLGDVDRHRATVQRFRQFARTYDWTVQVPDGAGLGSIQQALVEARQRAFAAFERGNPGEPLLDAADVFTRTHCTGGRP